MFTQQFKSSQVSAPASDDWSDKFGSEPRPSVSLPTCLSHQARASFWEAAKGLNRATIQDHLGEAPFRAAHAGNKF